MKQQEEGGYGSNEKKSENKKEGENIHVVVVGGRLRRETEENEGN